VPERYLGRTLGSYRVESLLGSGGFAWVYKGFDPELEIPVAIKVLKPQFAGDPSLVERFRREASTAARLRHPNIIKIYAVGREAEAVYFVMDFLPGSLAEKLEAAPYLPEQYVLRIGRDVARALGFAHREGVIHRDIKVDNILFDAHGNAIVADFGIARAISGYTQQTGTNMVVGTPQYFAPEQARGKTLDGRADIYSLGVTLYRAITGRLPFEGDDWYEIARRHLEENPPPPRVFNPEISPEFEALILKCLAKSPEERPPSAEALAEQFDELLARKREVSTARTTAVPQMLTTQRLRIGERLAPSTERRRLKRQLGGVILALAGVAALATATITTQRQRRTSPPQPASLEPAVVSQPAFGAGATEGGSVSKGNVDSNALNFGRLLVSAPAGSEVFVDDRSLGLIGPEPLRLDSLPPGDYTVSAAVATLPACPTGSERLAVQVRRGRTSTVTLGPRACGQLMVSGTGYRNGKPQPGRIYLQLRALDGSVVREDTLPLAEPLVVPVGSYIVVLTQRLCFPYNEQIRVDQGQLVRVQGRLLCN
jgi:serine/threonine-protein kinase